jgi:hypothetical protein
VPVRVLVVQEKIVPRCRHANADVVVPWCLESQIPDGTTKLLLQRLSLRVDDARGGQDVLLVHREGAGVDGLGDLLQLGEGLADALTDVATEQHPRSSSLVVTVRSRFAGYQCQSRTHLNFDEEQPGPVPLIG